MALSRMHSVCLIGLDAASVEVEVDVSPASEKQTLVIIGLPDTAVKESKDRVLAAVKNSKFSLNPFYAMVNLAPGDLRKEGAFYDLPIAVGLLISHGKIDNHNRFQDYLLVGELALSGETRPIHGALAIAIHAKSIGKKAVLVPASNAKEAAAVPGIDVIPIHHLNDAVKYFNDSKSINPATVTLGHHLFQQELPQVDFADIKGQTHVKRAMEIAAAGGHNVLLSGPPGSGKTMLAKALIGIMPEMTVDEALETTKIHSIAGLLTERSLITQRPFRSPHHTVSYAGLIGGGAFPRPGEVSLAHNGILFLDELPEFSRTVLEVLRQPLEDKKVTISRAKGNFTYPTSFVCVAAMNPCPCGFLGHREKACKDTEAQINKYRGKISGPLRDRMDLHLEVPALKYHDLVHAEKGESSSEIQQRVKAARNIQHHRFGKVKTNAQMNAREIRNFCILDQSCQNLLQHAMDNLHLSGRACDRILRVALTIADLEGKKMGTDHVLEAINFRGHS